MSIDPRGFKTVVQSEAETFMNAEQLLLNATVHEVQYSANGVRVTLDHGRVLTADYAICTFRYVTSSCYTSGDNVLLQLGRIAAW